MDYVRFLQRLQGKRAHHGTSLQRPWLASSRGSCGRKKAWMVEPLSSVLTGLIPFAEMCAVAGVGLSWRTDVVHPEGRGARSSTKLCGDVWRTGKPGSVMLMSNCVCFLKCTSSERSSKLFKKDHIPVPPPPSTTLHVAGAQRALFRAVTPTWCFKGDSILLNSEG